MIIGAPFRSAVNLTALFASGGSEVEGLDLTPLDWTPFAPLESGWGSSRSTFKPRK